MKWINYSRFTGDDLGISAEDLMNALSDLFLESGFHREYMQFSEFNQQSLEALKEAIERALREGSLFDDQRMEQMMERLQSMSPEEFQQLVNRLMQKLVDEGYINIEQPGESKEQPQGGMGKDAEPRDVKVEITDKSIDFF